MTLPQQTGLAREVSPRPDSVEAVAAHARGQGYWSPGRRPDLRQPRQLLIDSGLLEATGDPVRRAALGPWPVLMWDAEPRGQDFVVEAIDGEQNSAHFWLVEDGDGTYRVCGFASDS